MIVNELVEIVAGIRAPGLAVLLVEPHPSMRMRLAERDYLLKQGRIVVSGTRESFHDDDGVRVRYLTLRAADHG